MDPFLHNFAYNCLARPTSKPWVLKHSSFGHLCVEYVFGCNKGSAVLGFYDDFSVCMCVCVFLLQFFVFLGKRFSKPRRDQQPKTSKDSNVCQLADVLWFVLHGDSEKLKEMPRVQKPMDGEKVLKHTCLLAMIHWFCKLL